MGTVVVGSSVTGTVMAIVVSGAATTVPDEGPSLSAQIRRMPMITAASRISPPRIAGATAGLRGAGSMGGRRGEAIGDTSSGACYR